MGWKGVEAGGLLRTVWPWPSGRGRWGQRLHPVPGLLSGGSLRGDPCAEGGDADGCSSAAPSPVWPWPSLPASWPEGVEGRRQHGRGGGETGEQV